MVLQRRLAMLPLPLANVARPDEVRASLTPQEALSGAQMVVSAAPSQATGIAISGSAAV